MANRGQLTEAIQTKMEAFMGRAVDRDEFRLLPYIQYVMVNEQVIDPNKINGYERAILAQWREAGHIEGGAGGLSVTREFWDFVCDIVFDGYVAYREVGE